MDDHELGLAASGHHRHDPIAGRERRDALTDLVHDAGRLEPGDVRRCTRRGRVETGDLEPVGAVQARGVHPHAHLTGPGNGIRVLLPFEVAVDDRCRVHPAMLAQRDGGGACVASADEADDGLGCGVDGDADQEQGEPAQRLLGVEATGEASADEHADDGADREGDGDRPVDGGRGDP